MGSYQEKEEIRMKRKNKIFAVVLCAAVLSGGAAATAYAGWVQNGGQWYYYNESGNQVYGQWIKDGNAWYYMDYNGIMARNQLIDDTYYVGDNGVMVVNNWQYIQDDPWTAEAHWYYFGADGRAYEDGWKTIGGQKYHFTSRQMDTGWYEAGENVYYLGSSGAMAVGWNLLYSDRDESWSDQNWYYFSSTGRMSRSKEQSIGGVTYIFDSYGRMLTGWVDYENFTSAYYDNITEDVNHLKYCDASGAPVSGWQYLVTPDGSDESWFYFREGKAYTPSYKTTPLNDHYGVAKINNKVYCFNSGGRMVTGELELSDGRNYYFDESGAMVTGRVTIDGEVFYYDKTGSLGNVGAGYTGVKDGYLYENGSLVRAEEGLRYEVVTVAGKTYLVNESGKVRTGGTVTDADGNKYKVEESDDGGYHITRVN